MIGRSLADLPDIAGEEVRGQTPQRLDGIPHVDAAEPGPQVLPAGLQQRRRVESRFGERKGVVLETRLLRDSPCAPHLMIALAAQRECSHRSISALQVPRNQARVATAGEQNPFRSLTPTMPCHDRGPRGVELLDLLLKWPSGYHFGFRRRVLFELPNTA
jgi:hypothetical protein